MIEDTDRQLESSISESNLFRISIEGELRNKLRTIITWSRFTALGGFVNMGLSVLILLVRPYSAMTGQSNFLSTIITLIISFFLNFFLLRFSSRLKDSLDNENQHAFTEATVFLKSYLRLLGILLVVGICIMVLAFFLIIGSRL